MEFHRILSLLSHSNGIALTLSLLPGVGRILLLSISPPPLPDRRKKRFHKVVFLAHVSRQAVCRNSFQSLVKPDIRRVELLKDVESKQDLILRLVVHDINEDQHRRSPSMEDSETDEEEQVLTEHRSFFFPPTAPPTDSTASVVSEQVGGWN